MINAYIPSKCPYCQNGKLSGADIMNLVNRAHDILKKFLDAHSGFNRDEMQNYLN